MKLWELSSDLAWYLILLDNPITLILKHPQCMVPIEWTFPTSTIVSKADVFFILGGTNEVYNPQGSSRTFLGSVWDIIYYSLEG